jgi:hypothetical protein
MTDYVKLTVSKTHNWNFNIFYNYQNDVTNLFQNVIPGGWHISKKNPVANWNHYLHIRIRDNRQNSFHKHCKLHTYIGSRRKRNLKYFSRPSHFLTIELPGNVQRYRLWTGRTLFLFYFLLSYSPSGAKRARI